MPNSLILPRFCTFGFIPFMIVTAAIAQVSDGAKTDGGSAAIPPAATRVALDVLRRTIEQLPLGALDPTFLMSSFGLVAQVIVSRR
jgi:hypothetical protein